MAQLTLNQLFEDTHERFNLIWTTTSGHGRVLVGSMPGGGVIGHLNPIHPFQVQIFGEAEMAYYHAGHGPELVARFRAVPPALIIVANGMDTPPEVKQLVHDLDIGLWHTSASSHFLVEGLRTYLARALADSISVHGVFMDVMSIGVLIEGESGLGKSELALELLSRGHTLIADDVVQIFRISPDTLQGQPPKLLRDFMEVRGLGLINVRSLFGETAVRPRKVLRLILRLKQPDKNDEMERLGLEEGFESILSVPVRRVVIPVAIGRNLGVLVETAVRSTILRLRGMSPGEEFAERQREAIDQEADHLSSFGSL